ncbi:MAG: ATP-binding protein [Spirochaetia bacterium]|jgi:hypothetical protein
MADAFFLVDPRLTALLSETYRSTEAAIKELVDNAWDADASIVTITLPQIISDDPITIEDNGSGMTYNEVKSDFLSIAKSRIVSRGDKTSKYFRKVKGRKGIGKFAGFVIADEMHVVTRSNGSGVSFTIIRSALEEFGGDLEHIKIPLTRSADHSEGHGTIISLHKLIQSRSFPKEDKLREMLVIEYGRESDFEIFINKSRVGVEDIPGETFEHHGEEDNVGKYHLSFKIADAKSSVKSPGISLRVNGKIVGKPLFFGLESDERVPIKLLKRVYGEIEADGLAEDVTADWGAVLENSLGLEKITSVASEKIVNQLKDKYYREFNLQKARLQKQINDRIQTLPQYKREFAQKEIEKILTKFYGESDEKIEIITNVVLNAIEKDEYYFVLDKLEKSKTFEVGLLAQVLDEFGVFNTGLIMRQFKVREAFLDNLNDLISREQTKEIDVHIAIEHNLWVLGRNYNLIASNKTLKQLVEKYLNEKFTDGERKAKRPDLLLAELYDRDILLIEFKRPNKTIGRDDENQAEKYRDDLIPYLGDRKIRILVIGGIVDSRINTLYSSQEVSLTTYREILSRSKSEIDWLLDELKAF